MYAGCRPGHATSRATRPSGARAYLKPLEQSMHAREKQEARTQSVARATLHFVRMPGDVPARGKRWRAQAGCPKAQNSVPMANIAGERRLKFPGIMRLPGRITLISRWDSQSISFVQRH